MFENNEQSESESDCEYSKFRPDSLEELAESAKQVALNLLPEKSKRKYERCYELFSCWCEKMKVTQISESVLLAYFAEQSKIMKSSTIWSYYSMLNKTIQVEHDINISSFKKLGSFLKKLSLGYEPIKSKTLSKDEVETFIKTAPDEIYLMKKVVLILGVAGACRRNELTKMLIDDIDDKGSILIVKVADSKTNQKRIFTLSDDDDLDISYLELYRKYLKLRPVDVPTRRLFLKYTKGVCIRQPVGVNSIGKIPTEVATFLKLPNPERYTGRCFRRTSATLLVEASRGNILQLKRLGGWKSSAAVAKACHMDNSISGKIATGQLYSPETATVHHETNQHEEHSKVSSASGLGGKTNSTFNNTNNSSEGENSNLSASRGDADLNEDASFGYTSTVCIPYSHGGWEKKQPLPHSSTLANISSESFVREDQYLSNVSGTSSATQDDTENHDEESNIDEDERGGENEDALVSFGNYLVSLLRRLPLDKSYQLQQQFISDTINATIQMDKERCLMSQKKKKKADLNKQLHRPSAHEDRRKRSTAKGLLKNSGHRVQNLQPNKMLSAGRSEISERQRESSPDVSIKGEPITSLVKIEIDNNFETIYCNGQPAYDSTGIADSP
ncbi:uncharacterized protein LOC128996267 isoform X1 [Macrosteles quadrilineatus]|uniref:uncharacterized protein LOC128996267 isoform X1 n=1 Tax=Macrosteles quadrilineatus TaxID=74068 RepID=UPI0023E25559|nr:uncharacterized protein LOC128996267 isoform X1 [Macrosteles quadrilineatus]